MNRFTIGSVSYFVYFNCSAEGFGRIFIANDVSGFIMFLNFKRKIGFCL